MKPKETVFEPQTLGDHLTRRRLTLKLTQSEAAKQLRVCPNTVLNWETGHTQPPVEAVPVILGFLGYDPFPEPQTLPERLLAKRRAFGLTIRQAAQQLGVDEGTWGAWGARRDDPISKASGTGRQVPWTSG